MPRERRIHYIRRASPIADILRDEIWITVSIARQPTLKGGALRDALIKAAHAVDAENPPVARVVIPR